MGEEIAVLTEAVESKTQLVGELEVSIATMKNDLGDTQASLAADKKFLAELKKSCATKTSEWEERSKTRAEELVALADTIKVLNDDDALDLFKKTLSSPSFVQVQVKSSALRTKALSTIHGAMATAIPGDRPGLGFIALFLSGKGATSGTFDQVVKMIDDMVALLKKEQQDDHDKKEYCATQFDLTDDKKKALNRKIEKLSNSIETAKEMIATFSDEISALTAGIKALDKSVADATAQRQEENVEFKSLIASDTAAKEVLAFAKNRLNQFYNPKLYKAPPKRELSKENRIYENLGGDVSTATSNVGLVYQEGRG